MSDPEDGAAPDHEEEEIGQELVDAELLLDELGREGLDPGQVEVAAGAGHDQNDVGADAQHRPGRVDQVERLGSQLVPVQDLVGIGLHAAARGDQLGVGRRGRGVVFSASGRRRRSRALGALRNERRSTTAIGFGQPQHDPAQDERRHGQQHERRPPGQGGDIAGHGEAQAGPEKLAGEDVAVDAAPFGALEVIADERGHDRTGRGRDHAQGEAGEEQLPERRHRRAPHHGHAPGQDGQAEGPGAAEAIRHHAEGQARHRRHQGTDGHQQADVGVADVQGAAQIEGRSPDGGGVGAGQGQHAGQSHHDPGPLPAPQRVLQMLTGAPGDAGSTPLHLTG